MKPLMLKLNDLYLCPGDESGAHVTDNANCCGCGNSNLASLGRILDRETTVASMFDILKEQNPEVFEELPPIKRLYRG